MSRKAYQKVIVRNEEAKPIDQDVPDKPNKLHIAEKNNELTSVADKIAGDVFHYKNWYYPNSRIYFPEHGELRFVEKYYPNAKGGPLYVDEPLFEADITDCYKKLPALKDQGLRYVIIKPGQTIDNVCSEFLGE